MVILTGSEKKFVWKNRSVGCSTQVLKRPRLDGLPQLPSLDTATSSDMTDEGTPANVGGCPLGRSQCTLCFGKY